MLNLIGVGRVNQILCNEVSLGAKEASDLLARYGVKPIARDGMNRLQWSKEEVEAVKVKVDKSGLNEESIVDPTAGALNRALNEIRDFMSAIIDGAALAEERRKKELSFIQERIGHGVAEAMAMWKPPAADAPQVDWSAVIKPAIAESMEGRFKALRNQSDSFMESLDQRVASILEAVKGHHKIAVEIKTRMDEVLRASNSAVSNVYTSQKVTREEIGKGLTRVESALDGLSENVKAMPISLKGYINELSVFVRRLDRYLSTAMEKEVAGALDQSKPSDSQVGGQG